MLHFEIQNSRTKVKGILPEELHEFFILRWTEYIQQRGARWPESIDCSRSLLNKRTGSFPTGWVGSILDWCDANGWKYDIDDKRPDLPFGPTRETNLPTPRYYQAEAIENILNQMRGIIAHPTGSGKTILAMWLVARLNRPTLYIVPNLLLLNQTYDEFCSYFGEENVGFIGEGQFHTSLCTIATIQTLWSRYKKRTPAVMGLLQKTEVLIFDEAHRIGGLDAANSSFAVGMKCEHALWRVALTATPGKEGGLDRKLVEAVTGRVAHTVSVKELVDAGFLAIPIVSFYEVLIDRPPYVVHSKAYKQYISQNTERNTLIVSLVRQLMGKNMRIFIIVSRVAHGQVLTEMIGKEASFLYGGSSPAQREEAFLALQKGTIKVIVGTILSEGLNIPNLDALVNAAGGQSDQQTTQRMGRALRRVPGKRFARIIDFWNNDGRGLLKHSKARWKCFQELEFSPQMITDGYLVKIEGDK